ncbi:MBL fold metallo-hydrolase [Lentzea sp. NPDC051838]|uniref:MBL fold metallo-hydrolase n=1 Tax=Lentzea sp. NPDC051838 TaxID=3154849 RepID=UPI00341D8648
MKLTILGSATPFPRRDSPCSGYLLSDNESTILLDCGSGVFAALLECVDPNELSGVWISHLHPDHFADLPALANWAMNTPNAKKISILGPEGWDLRMNYFLSGEADSDVCSSLFTIGHISDGQITKLGGFNVHSRAVHHSVTAFGVRITRADKSFAYSGDTGPCDALKDLASEADLFLCEAGAESHSEYHLTPQQAYDTAIGADARALILTHIPGRPVGFQYPWPDSIPVRLAEPGLQQVIGE